MFDFKDFIFLSRVNSSIYTLINSNYNWYIFHRKTFLSNIFDKNRNYRNQHFWRLYSNEFSFSPLNEDKDYQSLYNSMKTFTVNKQVRSIEHLKYYISKCSNSSPKNSVVSIVNNDNIEIYKQSIDYISNNIKSYKINYDIEILTACAKNYTKITKYIKEVIG